VQVCSEEAEEKDRKGQHQETANLAAALKLLRSFLWWSRLGHELSMVGRCSDR
jgi:hypothetical protein